MTAPLALITGGQQGIGLGIARALAGAGFRIAIASLPEPDHPSVTAALAGFQRAPATTPSTWPAPAMPPRWSPG